MGKILELEGQRFGRLIVRGFNGIVGKKRLSYRDCLCDCGNIVSVAGFRLKNGDTKSCGCYAIDRIKQTNTKHGMSQSKLERVYTTLKQRCNNKKRKDYKNYGGRGIVCLRDKFEDFYKDMGGGYKEGLTIDRINNDGNYCKENCRWVDRYTQSNNKRNNTYLEYNGDILTIAQRSKRLGIKQGTLGMRINTYKRSVQKTLTTKVK